jgi:hypothetical protein
MWEGSRPAVILRHGHDLDPIRRPTSLDHERAESRLLPRSACRPRNGHLCVSDPERVEPPDRAFAILPCLLGHHAPGKSVEAKEP